MSKKGEYIPRKQKEYLTKTAAEDPSKYPLTVTRAPRAKYTREEREQEADPAILKQVNKNVSKPIMRLSRFGRPKKYTPTKMRNKINDYFCHCEKRDMVPSIKGMMLYLGMHPEQIYTYDKYPEFKELLTNARMCISEWMESDVYQAKGQAAGKLAYMQNLHNWSNKNETEIKEREISVEEAQAKIAMLAPALLEMLKNPEVLAMLMPKTETIELESIKDADE